MAASLLAGCSESDGGSPDDADPAARGPIAIAELAFAAERPDDRDDFRRQPESTYAPDRPIWLYADYSGLAGEQVDSSTGGGDGTDGTDDADGGGSDAGGDDSGDGESGAVAIDLRQTVTVADPEGNLVVESQQTFQEELAPGQLEGYFTGTEILLAGRAAEGEYATTLSVTDRVSATQASETATFRIEE
ncbi:hypothetical protein GCM10028857_09860 [Salinarchaeum chitinilyticum]